MTKRILLALSLLVFVACRAKEDPADFIGKTVVQHAVFEAERDVIEKLVEIYEEENPDVKIRLVSLNDILDVPSGDITNGATRDEVIQIAQSSDVFSGMFLHGAERQKLTHDLSPFLEADSDFGVDDFYGDVLNKSIINGNLYVLPTGLRLDTIYYDQDLFDKAGVPYPEPGWSWDEFLAAAKALTIREGDQVVQWGYVDPDNNMHLYIDGLLTSPLVDETSSPPRPRLQDADVAAALEGYVALRANTDFIPKFEFNSHSDQASRLIQAKKTAMWINQTYGDRHSHATVPLHSPQGNSSSLEVMGLVMSAGTQLPQAAWDWMAFLSRQALEELNDTGVIPARRSVAESINFWDSLDAATAETLRFSLDHSFYGKTDFYPDGLWKATEDIIFNGVDVEVALAAAQISAEKGIATEIARINAIPEIAVVTNDVATVNPNATEIFFTVGVDEPVRFRSLVAEFSQLNPDIVVTFKAGGLDDAEYDFTALAETSDCFVAGPDIQKRSNQAAVLAVDALFDNDETIDIGDLFPLMRNQFSADGQLWAIPGYLTPVVIVYNRDMFDANDVAYPQSDWDMDDFLETAVALTSGEDASKVYGFVPDAEELFTSMVWLERMGVAMLDESVNPPTVNLTNPDLAHAVRWYANLATQAEVKPIFVNDISTQSADFGELDDRRELIVASRAAMWTYAGTLFEDGLDEEGSDDGGIDFATGVVALPVGVQNGGSNLLPAQGYYISADSDHRAQCWEWIKFLSASPTIPDGIPGRQSVANSADYRRLVGDDYADAYLSAVDSDVSSGSLFRLFVGDQNWLAPSVFWFGRAMQQIYDGTHTVELALDEAQVKIDDYRSCMITGGIDKPEVRTSCVQKIDASLSGEFE